MKKYVFVWDLLSVTVLSILLILTVSFFPDNPLRKVIGLPFILFFPGYSLLSFLFPRKGDLDGIERMALSFGMSIAISPLIGLLLNYTPFGIRLIPLLLSLSSFNIAFSILGIYGRFNTKNPFYPELKLNIEWKEASRADRILTVILMLAIISSIIALIYIIVTPKQGERFTEFYILGPEGKAEGYPRNLRIGEEASVIIGIANHEYRTVNYTVEVWLVNATFENKKIHMYFIDSFNVTLNHSVSVEDWTPQWERFYNFSINRKGEYKLWFLLFKEKAPPLQKLEDYAGSEAEQRILDAVDGKIQSLNLNLRID
ncbi:MAG TPA: DUF1616 domain-containing protein [Archaeoglobaceae archaeon]|nr:DUF1616 domain-containing protein [Archaeoglobaceae archaeon]